MIDEVLVRDLAATMAPYKIFKVGKKFVVKNNAGEAKASFEDRDKAVQYLRALYVNVKGAPKAAARKKWNGEQKRATTEKAHGNFADAHQAMKKKHKFRATPEKVHTTFVYGGAGSSNGGGVYEPHCADCGQPASADGHTASSGAASGTSAGGSAGGTATASLLEGAGGYPCVCGRDFASAHGLAHHVVQLAEVENQTSI